MDADEAVVLRRLCTLDRFLPLPGWLGLPTKDVTFSTWDITKSVLIFLGIPLAAGYLTGRIRRPRRGAAWYDNTFLPRIGPWALYGLLYRSS